MKTLEFIVGEISDSQITRHEVWVPPVEMDLPLEEAQFVGEIHGHLQLLTPRGRCLREREFFGLG